MLRFSLASLFGLIALAAAGSLALSNPNRLTAEIAWMVTLLVMLFAGIIAIFLRRQFGAFAAGFAIVAAGFFVLPRILEREFLVTDLAFAWLYESIQGPPAPPPPSPPEPRTVSEWMAQPRTSPSRHYGDKNDIEDTSSRVSAFMEADYEEAGKQFIAIGRCLTALLFGCLGGIVAVACRSRGRPK